MNHQHVRYLCYAASAYIALETIKNVVGLLIIAIQILTLIF